MSSTENCTQRMLTTIYRVMHCLLFSTSPTDKKAEHFNWKHDEQVSAGGVPPPLTLEAHINYNDSRSTSTRDIRQKTPLRSAPRWAHTNWDALSENVSSGIYGQWRPRSACTVRNTSIQIYWKFYDQKMAIFQIKNSDIFHISAQNIDCGYSLEPPRRGGSNEYPQSMFLSRNSKNNVYPCKPQFYYIKVGFKGVKII